jgi:glycosyltransferase involved in cell wall biosynthesis
MKEKTLLIVTTHFPPDARPGSHRVTRFTKQLAKLGWQIHVLTLTADAALYKELTDSSLLSKIPASVEVHRTGALRLRWPLSSLNSYLIPDKEAGWIPTACRSGVRIIREAGITTLLSSAPPWTTHVVCWWLKKRTGTPWVADIRDPWTRRPWLPEKNRQGVRYSLLKRIERTVVQSADRVILNTLQLHKEFCRFYSETDPAKFLTIPNGIDVDDFLTLEQPRTHSDRFVIIHGGSLYRKRDPRPFLQALGEVVREHAMSETGIFARFIGTVDAAFDVNRWLLQHRLKAVVSFEPPIAHDRYLQVLAAADVLLLIQPETDLQVPSKLFEYMALGKPILALAHNGATRDALENYPHAVVVDPYDVNALKEAILKLVTRQRPGDRGDTRMARMARLSAAVTAQELDRALEGVQGQ